MQHIAIIGLGLIGSSIAESLKKYCPNIKITGYDANSQVTAIAKKRNIEIIDDLDKILQLEVDLLILAMPVLVIEETIKKFANQAIKAKAITDVGSVKNGIIATTQKYAPYVLSRFAPSHPIAGRENSGITAATNNLFTNQTVIVTPFEQTSTASLLTVNKFWQSIGASVECMEATQHDRILSYTSHLPHLLSFCLVDYLANTADNKMIFHYAASGFRDFTRIAASDSRMWCDISVSNKNEILPALNGYIESLQKLKNNIEQNDTQKLSSTFKNAKKSRHYFSTIYNMKTQNTNMKSLTARPSALPLKGTISVAGDKSMSHRAIMLGAISEGTTYISNFLEGEDNLRTLRAFHNMQVNITHSKDNEIVIEGVGKYGLKAPLEPLNMGNSGTAMRLMSGILSAQNFPSSLIGDKSLSKRPMQRIMTPLEKMGAKITAEADGTPPMHIAPAKINSLDYKLPVASAQVKSAILLTGLYAPVGETITVRESKISRNHTETMLQNFGAKVTSDYTENEITTKLIVPEKLTGCHFAIPADISSAAFFIVAALIQPGSDLTIKQVGINPTRTGILNILHLMGANITLTNETTGFEPTADINIKYSQLKGIEIPQEQISLAIDEFPVLFIAAAVAKGTTKLTNASELRVKESDRLTAMADGLTELGVKTEILNDGITIYGQEENFDGGTIASHGDHRIAMAFAIASLRSTNKIIIEDTENITTSFPDFIKIANKLGFSLNTTTEDGG